MSALDGLTALEREQLRYIVERVPEWPEGHGAVWVTSVGWIAMSDPHEVGYQFANRDWGYPRWPTYSPEFTRAQYDAMKAELALEDTCGACGLKHSDGTVCCAQCIANLDAELSAPAIDYRAHCEALAGALEAVREGVNAEFRPSTFKDNFPEAEAALTRWKEEGK